MLFVISFLFQYRCRGSLLLRNGHSYWKSHDGVQRLYWGGSDRNGYCACGINGCLKHNT